MMMSMGGEVAVTASTHNGTAWQPLPQLLSPNASLLLITSAIKFRASVPDCNRVLATLEYLSADPVSPSVDEIARITVIVNDMGNYGCYNDCSTAEPVPLLAVSTIVIVNYGWFSHKWLLLRPGVLLGVATGIGMLLIVIASVCAWLYLFNRLLSARGTARKTISSLGVADGGLLEDECQQAQSATETADDGYTQDEAQGNSDSEYVMDDTKDTCAKDGVPEDGVAADLHVDCCAQDTGAASGASDVISGNGIHDCAQFDVANEALDVITRDGIHEYTQADVANEALDVITRDGIHEYTQADYPVSVVWQCTRYKGRPSEAIHDPDLAGYVWSTDSLENSCPASDTIEEIYDPDPGSDYRSSIAGGDFQITNTVDTVDHDLDGYPLPGNLKADGHTLPGNRQSTITVEGPLEGIGYCGHLEAADQHILPTNEPENTSMTNQIAGMPYLLPCELDYKVDKEGMQHLVYSVVSRVPLLEEESPERSRSFYANEENFMRASVSSSFIDNRLNHQRVEANQAFNDGESQSLESYENTADYQSSAVKLEAADRCQIEYPNQLNNERVVINDLLSSMPFGDSTSSSQSCTSTEEGNANLERTVSMSMQPGEDSVNVNATSDRY